MTNVRTFYSLEQVAFKENRIPPTNKVAPLNSRNYPTGPLASGIDQVNQRWEVPHGVQSVGMTTTFNLENVFELGQVEVYEQSERQPDVEFTINKAIDGTKPLWFMGTYPSGGNNLISRADYRVDIAFGIWPDSGYRATDTVDPISTVVGSGMFVSAATYTFPVDGFVTEELTFVGNDKIWASFDSAIQGQDEDSLTYPPDLGGEFEAPVGIPSGVFGYAFDPLEPNASEVAGPPDSAGVKVVGSGIIRREEVDIRRSILPDDIPGITSATISGINAAYVNGGFGSQGPGTSSASTQLIANANTDNIVEHIQSVTCSVDIGRTDLFELGSKRPFSKVIAFPIEVTATVEVITAQGDLVDARSFDSQDSTVANNTIIVRTTDGMQIDCGSNNRLASIDVGGGEAGGDSLTVTYNYQSFGTFNVSHDFYEPNHRVLVFNTGNSRFNQGFTDFTRSLLGIF